MEKVNRRSAMTLGAAAVAGLVAIPLTSQTASAEEHRWKKLQDAYVALKEARDEIAHTKHDWGGHKREAIEAIDRALAHLERMRDFRE